MSASAVTTSVSVAEQLCLKCGLCCNGALFKDVQLQSTDDAARLKALGLPLETRRGLCRFNQPCAALDGCRCRIYAERPARCRDFECALFKAVSGGRLEAAVALRTVRLARGRAARVRRLLHELGDPDEHLALSVRFRRTTKRIEMGDCDTKTAKLYGQLTLAVHDLNVLLSGAFYPGSSA